MPYNTVTCECGEDVEIFISQSEESGGHKTCSTCSRVIGYESPPGEGVNVTEIVREVGQLSQR